MAIKKDGAVIVETLIDTKGFNKGVGNMQKSVSGLSRTINKLGLAIAAAFSIKAVVNFGKECIELGSDLQEVQNVVDTVFKTMSEEVDNFAKGAAEAAGLSETMAKRYVGTFGAMAKAFGFAENEAFNMSTALTQLAGDVASFYNLTQDEAYTKLKSVFTGETESLKDLGVVMTQSALDSFAMAEGLGKTTKQMSEQEKVALRYRFVLNQLSTASGDFQRTSDGWANQMRILRLNIESIKASLGQGLINVLTPAIKLLNTLLGKLKQVADAFKALTEQIFGKQETQQAATNLGAIEDKYSGIADATEDAKKAQDKYLTGLDEINTFQTNEDVGVSDVGGGLIDTGVTGEINEDLKDTDGILEKLEERFPRLMQFLEDVGAKLKEIVEDIKLGDFKELGGDISDLAILLFDFLSESIDAVDWEGIGEKIGDFLAGIKWIDVIKSALKLKFNIWKAIAEVWFGSFKAAPIETTILTALGLLKFTSLGTLLGNKLKTAITTAAPGAIKDAFKNFASWIPHVVILGAIVEVGKKIVEQMKSVFDTSDWNIGDWIKNTLETSKQGWMMQLDMWRVQLEVWWQDTWLYNKLWELGDWWNTYIAPFFTHEKWAELIENVKVAFFTKWQEVVSWWENDVVTWFDEIFDNIKTKSSEAWSDIKTGITDFCDAVKNTFTSFKDGVVSIWNNIVSAIKNSINAIIGVINSMISGITTGINAVIESLNAVKFNMPDWLGGKSFGLNISKVSAPQIPYLATGAVIPPNAPFVAMLGDQKHGTNIEAPLDTIKQAVREVVGNGNGGQYQFTAQINRRTLFDEMIEEAKLRQDAYGRNPFDLGKGVRA